MYGFKYAARTVEQYDFNDLITAIEEYQFKLQDCQIACRTMGRGKDIDVFITNDIWRSCVHFQHRGFRAVRHILVSGDGDYLRSYEHIRAEFGDALDVQLYIYSWKTKCNARAPELGTVIYLDDLAGIFDPIQESA